MATEELILSLALASENGLGDLGLSPAVERILGDFETFEVEGFACTSFAIGQIMHAKVRSQDPLPQLAEKSGSKPFTPYVDGQDNDNTKKSNEITAITSLPSAQSMSAEGNSQFPIKDVSMLSPLNSSSSIPLLLTNISQQLLCSTEIPFTSTSSLVVSSSALSLTHVGGEKEVDLGDTSLSTIDSTDALAMPITPPRGSLTFFQVGSGSQEIGGLKISLSQSNSLEKMMPLKPKPLAALTTNKRQLSSQGENNSGVRPTKQLQKRKGSVTTTKKRNPGKENIPPAVLYGA